MKKNNHKINLIILLLQKIQLIVNNNRWEVVAVYQIKYLQKSITLQLTIIQEMTIPIVTEFKMNPISL